MVLLTKERIGRDALSNFENLRRRAKTAGENVLVETIENEVNARKGAPNRSIAEIWMGRDGGRCSDTGPFKIIKFDGTYDQARRLTDLEETKERTGHKYPKIKVKIDKKIHTISVVKFGGGHWNLNGRKLVFFEGGSDWQRRRTFILRDDTLSMLRENGETESGKNDWGTILRRE